MVILNTKFAKKYANQIIIVKMQHQQLKILGRQTEHSVCNFTASDTELKFEWRYFFILDTLFRFIRFCLVVSSC